jgi:hypothetical protein
MKIEFLHEPELEFGAGRHIDIKFGLMNYGPLDYASPSAPKQIKLGIIGTTETIEGVQSWLERCRNAIPAKQSRQPYLFPRFPGCNPDASFRTSIVLDPRLLRTIPQREFDFLRKLNDVDQIVREAVEKFAVEVGYLAENSTGAVLICAIPMTLLDRIEELTHPKEVEEETEGSNEAEGVADEDNKHQLDFHDMLKARAMALKVPIQIILPPTYDETKRRQQKAHPERTRKLQDEATRAWNFHTALYYKAGGTPWRLIREASQLTTCYIGVSFYKTLDGSRLMTSIAQVFNERGDGVIVRGGPARISKDDRQPHLQGQDAYQLLSDALARYRQEHHTLPARVVLHKSSTYNAEEIEGFTSAIQAQRIEYADFLSLSNSFTRLFRNGAYPPLRGTFFSLDHQSHILYTRGSVDFFATYPGMYVPLPLSFRCAQTEHTPKFLAQEILALTKMNWNNTQFDGGDPITLRASYQVGAILKYVGEQDRIEPRYSYYM